jgi:hypothetical protein
MVSGKFQYLQAIFDISRASDCQRLLLVYGRIGCIQETVALVDTYIAFKALA